VTHQKDVFVSHVISKLNTTDRLFLFKGEFRESGCACVRKGRRIEIMCAMFTNVHPFRRWNGRGIIRDGERKMKKETVVDQAWFCKGVAGTNKLEFLKWAREVKHCEWDEKTITVAALIGNLEMLKYCFSNECPYDEKESCRQAAQ